MSQELNVKENRTRINSAGEIDAETVSELLSVYHTSHRKR